MAGHIVAIGGGWLLEPDARVEDPLLELAPNPRPRVCFVPTAKAHEPANVREGFPPGYAAGDDAALVFEGTELREVVAQREGALGYRVTAAGEEPLEARLL